MRQRHADAQRGRRTRLPAARLREIAEEVAVHAEVGLAMAGIDEAYESVVEPTGNDGDPCAMQVRFLDESGEGLGLVVLVCRGGLARACDEDEAFWCEGPGPWRGAGEMDLLAADAARLARATVTARLIN